jgi:putative acetyltransferase
MIILIGGVGYAGKTLMAQRLLEKYNFPYLSVDHLKMGLYRSGDKCDFTPEDSAEAIGEKLWGILKGIILTNIENKQNLIVEGVYLLPKETSKLESETGGLEEDYKNQIISFCLGFSAGYIEKNFHELILGNKNAIEERLCESEQTLEEYIAENQKLRDLCGKYNVKYFEIQRDYNKEIGEIYDWVDNQLAEATWIYKRRR